MRISSSWGQQAAITSIINQGAQVQQTQTEVSTGMKTLKPSDGPSATVSINNLTQNISQMQQYQTNNDAATQRLSVENSSMQSASGILNQINALCVQGMNGSNNASDKASIGAQIQSLNQQLVSVANTQDFNGEYIFSGTKSTTPPFTQDPSNPGAYVYSGNSDQRQIQVGPNASVAVGDPGNSVFGAATGPAPATVPAAGSVSNIFEAINQFVTTLTTNPVKGSAQSTLQATHAFTLNGVTIPAMAAPASKLTAIPPIADAVTQGTSVAAAINLAATGVTATADPTTGALTFTDSITGLTTSVIVDGDVSNTGLTVGTLASGVKGSAQSPLQATHAFTINGTTIPAMAAPLTSPPAADSVTQGTSVAAAINLLTSSTGVTATADPTTGAITLANKTGAAIAVAGDISNTGLSVATTSSGTTLQASLSDVTKGANQILSINAVVGGRLNILTTQSTINSGSVLNMQTTLSSVQNIDEAAAISALNMQSIALQASQQAYSLVNKLSLFNYMN